MTDPLMTAYRAAMNARDYARADVLSAQLNTDDATREARLRQTGALRYAALFYASLDLAVFPVSPGLKVPLPGTHGFKDASTDPERVAAWWARWPTANVGLPTGGAFDVIDIDGPPGYRSWAQVRLDGTGFIPPTPIGVGRTPHGRHLYVPVTGRGNTAGLLPGVDYRGAGGYVVAPPSVLACCGWGYRWIEPLALGPWAPQAATAGAA
jgi:hypothetical protein